MSIENTTPEITTPVISPTVSPDPSDDQPPCGSAEFGVGGFFPHLDAAEPADPLDEGAAGS